MQSPQKLTMPLLHNLDQMPQHYNNNNRSTGDANHNEMSVFQHASNLMKPIGATETAAVSTF